MKNVRKWIGAFVLVVMCIPWNVAAQKKIVIAATDWAPYSGSSLLNGGFLSEITITAFRKAGYDATLIILPWKRALEMTKEGKYDALLGASYTKERTLFFAYPKHSWNNHVFFFVKKETNRTYVTLKDFCPARIGVFLGSFYAERFRKIGCLTVEEVPTIQQNIKKLLSDRIDLFIDSKDAVVYYINKEFPGHKNDIKTVLPCYENDKIYLVISKKIPKSAQMIRDYDLGIKAIKADGSYQKIIEKHGITPFQP